MPRYHITTVSDRLVVDDDEGIEVADAAALARLMRASVVEMATSEGLALSGPDTFTAHAFDQDGRRVVSATVTLTTTGPDAA